MTTVYISIGNTDNKLTQQLWAAYCATMRHKVEKYSDKILGMWYSISNSQYQNACFAIEIKPPNRMFLKRELRQLATDYSQDSIAWAVIRETEFIEPYHFSGNANPPIANHPSANHPSANHSLTLVNTINPTVDSTELNTDDSTESPS